MPREVSYSLKPGGWVVYLTLGGGLHTSLQISPWYHCLVGQKVHVPNRPLHAVLTIGFRDFPRDNIQDIMQGGQKALVTWWLEPAGLRMIHRPLTSLAQRPRELTSITL